MVRNFFFFFTVICWERHQIGTFTTKNKRAKAIFQFFFINQTSIFNIYVENATNLQSRAGRDFFGGVQPVDVLLDSLVYLIWVCIITPYLFSDS